MSYPQAKASQEVIEGQEVFRLKTVLESSGDVYEIDTSAKSFAIGPQSDISRVLITYFDPTRDDRSGNFPVAVGAPFVGRIDSFSTEKYPLANTRAQILVSSEELINNAFLPEDFSPGDILAFQKPCLDLIAYLGNPVVSLSTERPDRLYEGRIGMPAAPRVTWIIVPWYGRKYASMQAINYAAGTRTVGAWGVNILADRKSGSLQPAETNLVLPTPILITGTNIEVRRSNDGAWDYLIFKLASAPGDPAIDPTSNTSTIYYQIRLSDEET